MKADEEIMKAAKNLYEEFATALEIPIENVVSVIMEHVS